MINWIWIVVGILAVAVCAVGYLLLKERRNHSIELAELKRQAKYEEDLACRMAERRAVAEQEYELALKTSLELMDELRTELVRKGQETLEWQRKSKEFQSSNAGILAERDRWIALHSSETAAHGNAQACMMDFINTACRRLNQAGVKLEVPEVLRHTQEVYTERYLEPVIRTTGSPVVHNRGTGLVTAATMATGRTEAKSLQPENQPE